jgi:hypothetical protein
MRLRTVLSARGILQSALVLAGLFLFQSAASAQVNLSTTAVPPSGLAGTTIFHVAGNGFPGGIPNTSVTVSFGATCLSLTPAATTASTHVTHVAGTTDYVYATIPGTLPTGTYAVWVSGSLPSSYTSSTCATLTVSNTTKTLSSCIPSSSLAVSLGSTVTAYVPNGCWECGNTGVQVVPIEGGGSPSSIATAGVVNACSSDALTGETVCTANNTDVYTITGTTLNSTLTSSANRFAGFSGGSCENCGVAINAATNTAYVAGGFSGGLSGDGIQALNLANNTFAAPFPAATPVSENIAVDPTRSLIFSPNENSIYDVFQIATNGSLSEFEGPSVGGEGDSATEDCVTGLALSSVEFTNNVFIEDITQAAFTPGTPGSYTAPNSTLTMVTDWGFSAGTSGISIAPGSSHLAVVTGEFGGNTFAILQLPSTSGSGTPSILDYAVAAIPANPAGGSSPCAGGFSAGLDPHTVTAYTSPNDGKAYAVFASGPPPSCLVRIDMAAILAAPRGGSGFAAHDVASADFPASAATYYATH